ncbi:unnamed protein product [Danaus chrysippus]|uniref:(African queen) hypothetical protein n=1 Tax=Danaus chrysippus TaxID=151541 RepID=A0A8J2QE32_9NEOP|nr:unnamed protein product [Danaus chrysippus]
MMWPQRAAGACVRAARRRRPRCCAEHSKGSRGAGHGAGARARALAVCDLGTRGEVPELALQRGDRHRVQANKPNTTSSTALQNFTSALSRSSLVRRIKKLNGVSSVFYEKRHVVVRRSTARLSLVYGERGAAAGS